MVFVLSDAGNTWLSIDRMWTIRSWPMKSPCFFSLDLLQWMAYCRSTSFLDAMFLIASPLLECSLYMSPKPCCPAPRMCPSNIVKLGCIKTRLPICCHRQQREMEEQMEFHGRTVEDETSGSPGCWVGDERTVPVNVLKSEGHTGSNLQPWRWRTVGAYATFLL